MLYRAHLAAGIAVGGAATAAAATWGAANTPEQRFGIFGLWVVFSLLPDLDTASITQRWFYRGVFILLAVLLVQGRVEAAAFFGAAATLPLVHRHRGWMHAPWAAFAVPVAALLLWDLYWRSLSPGSLFNGETVAGYLPDVMMHRGIYLASMIGGYLLHLCIDFWAPAAFRWGRLA